jgi:hypothetical protein
MAAGADSLEVVMGLALTFVEKKLQAGSFGRGLVDGFNEVSDQVSWSRRVWREYRAGFGLKTAGAILTDPGSQPKLGKSERAAYGLMLTPARGLPAEFLGRTVNLCPMASKGCEAACLGPNSGKGVLSSVKHARNVRTGFVLTHPYEAGVLIGSEIRKAQRKHGKVSLRLNTVSDIRWELVARQGMEYLISQDVRMYDYTAWKPESREPMPGYHLTYSAKEPAHTPDAFLTALLAGDCNVAMPFAVRKGQPLPETWHGFKVIDGDLSDDRTLDPSGVVVGLRQKGRVKDETGFIRSV